MTNTILSLTVYLLIVFFYTGAGLAFWQRKYPNSAKYDYKTDLMMCFGISIYPFSWFVIPFITIFFKYGWLNPITYRPPAD